MYQQHFGLNERPFPAKARSNDVFVGPQTAKTMASLKKALASQDAVVAVSGPAGSGKTTLIAKALDALPEAHKTVRIGRMRLAGEDALEFLLEELGLNDLPKGPIRQFAALRARLHEMETENSRLVVVVEDAVRMGEETVAELEALTGADAGDAGGAALVLMGDEQLEAFCNKPQLKRLAQRVRQRLSIEPLCAAELRGYLMHCFRRAGADFELVFDDRSAALVHHLSEGIPRIANNIVEASLAAAAAAGVDKLGAMFVADVARDEFGFDSSDFDLSPPQPVAAPDPEPERERAPDAVTVPEPAPDTKPAVAVADATDEELPIVGDIPELIQDTLPDLEVLAPEIMAADNTAEAVPDIPELQPKDVSASDIDDTPDWERDPTVAELKPDLDALEKAMAFAHGESDDGDPAAIPDPEVSPTPNAVEPEQGIDEIPEITLDNAIQTRVANNLIDEPGEVSPAATNTGSSTSNESDVDEVDIAPQKADAELEKIAADLARAKTIEDVDDKLAETLFGEEINLVAAQIIASGAAGDSANDGELQLFDTQAAFNSQAVGQPQSEAVALEAPDVTISLETSEHIGESGLDLSASQRLKTVRALNADLNPSLREPADKVPDPTADEVPATDVSPEPIEDQIDTSITQTLKTLNVKSPPSAMTETASRCEDDEPENKKGGFFSRFKRS